MSAAALTPTDRFAAPLPRRAGPRKVPRFTWPEVMELLRLGIIPEDASTELFDGQIVLVDRSGPGQEEGMHGRDHVKCTKKFMSLASRIDDAGRYTDGNSPLVLTATHAPMPDFMVVRGKLDDYDEAPTAADVLCVVEVSDTSYEFDTGEKLAAYARAGVPQYVVVNLRDRTAEVREHPDREAGTYPPPAFVTADGTLSLRVGDAGEAFEVRLADVLP